MTSTERRKIVERAARDVEVALPAPGDELTQDKEWVVAKTDDGWRKIRLHDYASVFSVPGLYERWVYEILGCRSPAEIRDRLRNALREAGVDPMGLRVFDLGAGNGYVAEELAGLGVERFLGVDIHPEAAEAAERDRPGLYERYVVGDLTSLDEDAVSVVEEFDANCLTCVAALGFGDIPPEVFAKAFDYLGEDGWAAFTIKQDFLDPKDDSGFSKLIRRMIAEGVLELASQDEYVHRISTEGEELVYVALIGRKRGEIDPGWIE
ncbi:MAG: class I SAM-dependent DNA methyltransferase [Phycisphaerales bacterium JB040]